MKRHHTLACLAFVAASAISVTSASAFPTEEVPKTEPEYIAKVKTAAPASIVNNATMTMPQADGSSKTLQTGSNGYTCFIGKDGTPECDDQNATEWRKALGAGQTPPNKIGFIYMLAGDAGTSNHDASQRHGFGCDPPERRNPGRQPETGAARDPCARRAGRRPVPGGGVSGAQESDDRDLEAGSSGRMGRRRRR